MTPKKLTAALLATLLSGPAFAEYALNMTKGVTPFSKNVYELHMIIFWICVVIGVVVFGAMFYSMFHHRKSKGVEPAQFSHSTKAEIAWTIIPCLILVGMAWPATKSLILMEQSADADMTVKITGYQWMWGYEYLEDGIQFYSSMDDASNRARQVGSGIDPRTVENYLIEVDNPVVLPTNTKIQFLITAADVLHAWWVRDLGWKRDAIPGYINKAWTLIEEPGIYRGKCAELCGKDHGFMPIVVKAVPPEEYRAWVAEQQGEAVAQAALNEQEWAHDDLMVRGESVYREQCAACHMDNGEGLAPAFPSLKGSDVLNGPRSEHIELVLKGKPATAMQGYGDRLSDADIAAALTYTRSTWGETGPDTVQPADVRAAERG